MMSAEQISKRDVGDLRHFFGSDAAIRHTREGGFVASGNLKDGFCPGGQEFEVEVMPRKKVMQYHLGTDYVSPSYDAFPSKRISVNGLSLETPPLLFVPPGPINRFVTGLLYLLPQKERQDVGLATTAQMISYNENTHAEISHIPHFIVLNSFHSADDIGVLFHEMGEVHHGVSEKRMIALSQLRSLRKSIWIQAAHGLGSIVGFDVYQEPKFKEFRSAIFQRLRAVLMSERQASQYAVKQIRHLNQGRQLFPEDVGNSRLRKFFQVAMLSYRKLDDGYYERFLSRDQKQELDELMDLK